MKPETNKYETATIYCRISTTNQTKGFSLDVQSNICKQWCNDHNIKIIDIVEEISSARDMTILKQLKYIVKHIRTNYLIVSDVSRFGRNICSALNFLKELDKKNVKFYAVFNGTGYDSYNDKYKIHELLNQSQYESDRLSFRIKKSNEFKKKNNIYTKKNPPYGYTIYIVDGYPKLRINREETKIINEIITLHKKGNTFNEISEKLKELNIYFDVKRIKNIYFGYKRREKKNMEDTIENLNELNFE